MSIQSDPFGVSKRAFETDAAGAAKRRRRTHAVGTGAVVGGSAALGAGAVRAVRTGGAKGAVLASAGAGGVVSGAWNRKRARTAPDSAFGLKKSEDGMSIESDPFGVSKGLKVTGVVVPKTSRRAQAAQDVLAFKGTGKKTLETMDKIRPKGPVKKSDPFEISKLKDRTEDGLAAGAGAVGGGVIGARAGGSLGARGGLKLAGGRKAGLGAIPAIIRGAELGGAAGAAGGAAAGAVGGLKSSKMGRKHRAKKKTV